MPGYIFHMLEGHLLEEGLPAELRKETSWIRSFREGILLPDSVARQDKCLTHFWSDKDAGCFIRTPDLKLFLSQYGDRLSDPLLLGYFAHLHLDVCFFEHYVLQIIRLLDEKGRESRLRSEIRWVTIREKPERIPLATIFSEAYLYGDYTRLNQELMEQYGLVIPERAGSESMAAARMLFPELPFGPLEQVYDDLRRITGEGARLGTEELKLLDRAELKQLLTRTMCAFWENSQVKQGLSKALF